MKQPLYRWDPAAARPVYCGGYYEKTGGLPAPAFRWLCTLISAVCLGLLTAAGSHLSGNLLRDLPAALALLMAVRCLFAALPAPAGDGPIREDRRQSVFSCLRLGSAAGFLLSLAALPLAAARQRFPQDGPAFAAAALGFAVLSLLERRQTYRLRDGT